MAINFLFYKEQRELEVKELLIEASKSPEDYLNVIGKVERAIKEKRTQKNDDKGFMQKIQKVIAGLRSLAWAEDKNAAILRGQVDLNELDSILDKLKNNSWRLEKTSASKEKPST